MTGPISARATCCVRLLHSSRHVPSRRCLPTPARTHEVPGQRRTGFGLAVCGVTAHRRPAERHHCHGEEKSRRQAHKSEGLYKKNLQGSARQRPVALGTRRGVAVDGLVGAFPHSSVNKRARQGQAITDCCQSVTVSTRRVESRADNRARAK